VLQSLNNVPMLAMGVSIFVSSVPALQRLFVASPAAAAAGKLPPLDVVTQAISLLGAAMLPCILICMGGSLLSGPGSGKVAPRVLATLSLLRLLVLPSVGTALVLGTKAAGEVWVGLACVGWTECACSLTSHPSPLRPVDGAKQNVYARHAASARNADGHEPARGGHHARQQARRDRDAHLLAAPGGSPHAAALHRRLPSAAQLTHARAA